MTYGAIAVAVIGGVVNYSNAKGNRELAESQYEDQKEFRDREQKKLDAQKDIFRAQKFTNPFAEMENVYEDLTVNQQAAQFQAKQGAQQRANIMQGLRGAAGASGIAGLAQSLANQGQLQTATISAGIGKQEAANRLAAAKGAAANQIAERQGDQWVQQQEINRQGTLLGMQMGESAGANQAAMQAQANQMNAAIATQQATADAFKTTAGLMAGSEDFQEKAGGADNNIFTTGK